MRGPATSLNTYRVVHLDRACRDQTLHNSHRFLNIHSYLPIPSSPVCCTDCASSIPSYEKRFTSSYPISPSPPFDETSFDADTDMSELMSESTALMREQSSHPASRLLATASSSSRCHAQPKTVHSGKPSSSSSSSASLSSSASTSSRMDMVA